jgi:hypothetical protein
MAKTNLNIKRWMSTFSASLVVTLSCFSADLLATPITVTAGSNVPGSVYVPSGFTGGFDLSSSMPGHTAQSGSITATFVDDGDPYSYAGQNNSGYIYNGCGGGWFGCNTFYYYQNKTTYYYDQYESAALQVGSSTAGASSNYFDTGPYYQGSSSYWNGNYNYTDYYYNDYYGYNGSFSVTIALDAAALSNLNSSGGLLDFSVFAYSGDFLFTGAYLTANLVDVIPPPPPPAVGVPEPSPLLLLALGLGAIAFSARRRSKTINC